VTSNQNLIRILRTTYGALDVRPKEAVNVIERQDAELQRLREASILSGGFEAHASIRERERASVSKVVAVCIDAWKLPIFKQRLDAAGYTYEDPVPFTLGTLLIKVEYEWVHELQPIIEMAQHECAKSGPPA
jgi:hypothetical protein